MDDLPILNYSDTTGVDLCYDEIKEYLNLLPSGSIFLTKTRNYAITEFIPGEWKHAGIFLGNKQQIIQRFGKESNVYKRLDSLIHNDEIYILDSEADGVCVHPFRDMSNMNIKSYMTSFVVFSFTKDDNKSELFLEKAMDYLGREYDFDWITEDDSNIYCSELIYHSLKPLNYIIKKRSKTLSRVVITPDDLYNYLNHNTGREKKFELLLRL